MRDAALLILVLLLPTAAGYAILAAVRASRRLAESRRQPPPPESAERLTATLRRLRAQLEMLEVTPGVTGRNRRMLVLRGAYLDALRDACARLDVAPPAGGDRASLAEIYRTEAALRGRGLDVRETAAH